MRAALDGEQQRMSNPVEETVKRFPRRWRDDAVVQRAMLQDVPVRILLLELWRRALAWVDGRWTR